MKRTTINAIAIAALLWCASALLPVIADDDAGSKEAVQQYRIKIAFIYNFLKFVEWPGDNSPQKSNSANVCIVGDKGFSDYFKEFQATHKQGLSLNIQDSVSGNAVAGCHILYIGKDEEGSAGGMLNHAKRNPVLSISEMKDFTDMGGVIEMVKVGKSVGLFSKDKINLRINMRAAEAEHLNIDARLLQIAAEVIR